MMRAIIGAAALCRLMAGPAAASEPVDLALVLAIDVSGSVNREEYELQTYGIAAAFRQPDIVAAIQAGRFGRISVNLMSWGDPDYEKLTTGWHTISDLASSEGFADVAEKFEGRTGGGTGIGRAIGFGITLIETSGLSPLRKVIDVSGDGPESWELREPRFKLANAQALRAKHGVIVNGLAITNDAPDLEIYYRSFVAAGPGSFVISISDYEGYAEAIRRKLLQEIQPGLASRQREPQPALARR